MSHRDVNPSNELADLRSLVGPPKPVPPGPLARPVKPAKQPKRMKPINRERKARLNAAAFGPQARACRLLPCCVCAKRPPSDPAHAVSRGAGGRDNCCVPLCRAHHEEQHQHGIETFQKRHNIILDVVAGELAAALKEHTCAAWPVDVEGKGTICALCESPVNEAEVTP